MYFSDLVVWLARFYGDCRMNKIQRISGDSKDGVVNPMRTILILK